MSINRVVITGNLTYDPSVRETATGTVVLGFGMAVNDRHRNQQTGEWEDYPNFIDCAMFGARAKAVAPYLQKGSKVAVEGRLHWNQWEQDGQKKSKVSVVVDNIEFMQGRKDTELCPQSQVSHEAQYAPQYPQSSPQPQYTQTQAYSDPFSDDIPF